MSTTEEPQVGAAAPAGRRGDGGRRMARFGQRELVGARLAPRTGAAEKKSGEQRLRSAGGPLDQPVHRRRRHGRVRGGQSTDSRRNPPSGTEQPADRADRRTEHRGHRWTEQRRTGQQRPTEGVTRAGPHRTGAMQGTCKANQTGVTQAGLEPGSQTQPTSDQGCPPTRPGDRRSGPSLSAGLAGQASRMRPLAESAREASRPVLQPGQPDKRLGPFSQPSQPDNRSSASLPAGSAG